MAHWDALEWVRQGTIKTSCRQKWTESGSSNNWQKTCSVIFEKITNFKPDLSNKKNNLKYEHKIPGKRGTRSIKN